MPGGNFGNICAGLLAKESGLPAGKFIAACNANDIVPRFLQTGEKMIPKLSVSTISNAMDVGNPSNFVRISKLFYGDTDRLREKMEAVSVSDETTANTMREVYKNYNYILDPHGAVGFYALEKYLEQNPYKKGFFLATAHPVKFDSVTGILGTSGEMPDAVEELLSRPKQSVEMNVDYDDLKDILLGKI